MDDYIKTVCNLTIIWLQLMRMRLLLRMRRNITEEDDGR